MDAISSGTFQDSSSTRTGSSSKSQLSENLEERDFNKDSKSSPIDLECAIQEERMTKIMDGAIYKTKLAICLPALIRESMTLKSVLSTEHFEDLQFIFDQYDNPLFSGSLLNIGAMEEIKAGDVSLKNRLNPELGHLIYILYSYPELRPKVDQLIQEMTSAYHRNSKNAAPGLEYLFVLEHFTELLIEKMSTSADEELAEKIWMRKFKDTNKKLLAEIDGLTSQINAEYEEFMKVIGQKEKIIRAMEDELVLCEQDTTARLKKKILDSERQMVLKSRGHEIKHELLREEEIETRENYYNLLNLHLADEKNQRARRFKVETQMISWLQKYDTEMSDKQVELEDYSKRLEDETEKVEQLNKDIAMQDLEFLPLMAERDAEYAAEMTEKMKAFGLDHAARVIQLAWREVLANRAEKRKLKKILQKRKEEEEGKTKKPAKKK